MASVHKVIAATTVMKSAAIQMWLGLVSAIAAGSATFSGGRAGSATSSARAGSTTVSGGGTSGAGGGETSAPAVPQRGQAVKCSCHLACSDSLSRWSRCAATISGPAHCVAPFVRDTSIATLTAVANSFSMSLLSAKAGLHTANVSPGK
jgi:hypothetical protein